MPCRVTRSVLEEILREMRLENLEELAGLHSRVTGGRLVAKTMHKQLCYFGELSAVYSERVASLYTILRLLDELAPEKRARYMPVTVFARTRENHA